jgi:hypothetical protein
MHLRRKESHIMKTKSNQKIVLAFSLIAMLFLNACRDKIYEKVTYTANIPVYMEFDAFRQAVLKSDAQALVNPGKIYFKDNVIFINEIHEGIHLINNSNPAAPEFIAFIEIPGNVDIAIKGNILYADSYIDLVALDISDPFNPVEIDRLAEAFPNVLPPFDVNYPVYGLDFKKGVVVGWETKEITEMVERGSYYRGDMAHFDGIAAPNLGSAEISISQGNTGTGGSMARFTLSNDHLYAVHNENLKIFNISNTPGIFKENEVFLERLVETIFPYENKLFLGTTTGMLVYGLSNPALPNFISVFEHISSCDPVVVEGNLAYVTLRSGTMCGGFTNQLDVVDISSIENPFLVKTYPMYNPHGLGIDNGTLFICDGDAGLKVYSTEDPMNIHQHQLAHFDDIKTFDVIPLNGLLVLIGADGLYQYDYTDLENLTLLSHMPVTRP